MTIKILRNLISLCLSWLLLIGAISCPTAMAGDISVLPSWKNGGVKYEIIGFVDEVTNPGSLNYVPPKDRIAVFDNDGTLWAEKPCYFQESFILSRQDIPDSCEQDFIRHYLSLSGEDLNEDYGDDLSLSVEALNRLDAKVLDIMPVDEYKQKALEFLTTKIHPRFRQPYVKLTYKPMIELIDYLQKKGFQVYISSGGSMDFIRSFAEDAYGIPPQNVIGSTVVTRFPKEDIKPGEQPYLVRTNIPVLPTNNEYGKPVGIERYIGKKPIIAVGNSFGDLQMFQYTDDPRHLNLIMLLNHDDPEREYRYTEDVRDDDHKSIVDVAGENAWHVISMKNDFIKVFDWQ